MATGLLIRKRTNPETPRVAKDSRSTIVAEGKGTVSYVDSTKIEIKYDLDKNEKLVSFDEKSKSYELIKFMTS